MVSTTVNINLKICNGCFSIFDLCISFLRCAKNKIQMLHPHQKLNMSHQHLYLKIKFGTDHYFFSGIG